MAKNVIPEKWKENLGMSRTMALNLSDELQPFIEGQETRMREPINCVKQVAIALTI